MVITSVDVDVGKHTVAVVVLSKTNVPSAATGVPVLVRVNVPVTCEPMIVKLAVKEKVAPAVPSTRVTTIGVSEGDAEGICD